MGLMDFVRGGVREMMIARPDNNTALIYKHPDRTIPMYAQVTVRADDAVTDDAILEATLWIHDSKYPACEKDDYSTNDGAHCRRGSECCRGRKPERHNHPAPASKCPC